MPDKIVLHGMGSPNVVKCVIMLEECELDYTLRHVAVITGEQFTPEFQALNPLGKVPVLEDSRLGQPIAESGAILMWLAEREGRFLPTVQPARADVIWWLMVQMANVGPMLGQLTHFNIAPPDTAPYAKARYRAIAGKLFRALDDRLSTREWLAGGEYSIADMATEPWAYYLEQNAFDPAEYPHLVRWREAIGARPAARRARARIDAELTEPSTLSRKSASPEQLDRFFSRTEEVPPTDFSAVQRM